MKPVNDRHNEALALRQSGMTYTEIAARYGVTRERARQMVLSAQARRAEHIQTGTIQELPTRVLNALRNAGLQPTAKAEDVMRLADDIGGATRWGTFLKIKNMGRASLRQLQQWLKSYGYELESK